MKIILVVVDTLRADHLGCYGYFRDTSPTLDGLAKEGTIFDDFHSSAVVTGPAFTSIFTGLFPIQHGFYYTPAVFPNQADFDDDIPTFPEVVWENTDYTTAAFDNMINFRSPMDQFVRGFEYYVNVTRTPMWNHHKLLGRKVNERLLPWIERHSEEDFLAFVHYWDPHTPYNHPDRYRDNFHHEEGDTSDLEVRQAPAGYDYVPGWGKTDEMIEGSISTGHDEICSIDLYDEEIRYTDHLISQLISTIKGEEMEEDTVVILTSDHGEQLGQHKICGHFLPMKLRKRPWGHIDIHEANTKVPLIVWGDNVPKNRRIGGFAQHTDIAPTILDLIGAEHVPKMAGKSLLPNIKKGKSIEREEAYIECYPPFTRGFIKGDLKYIRHLDGSEELYDLNKDPMETENRYADKEIMKTNTRRYLERWVQEKIGWQKDPMIEAKQNIEESWEENSYIPNSTLPWI